MIAELGHITIAIAFAFSLLLAVVPLIGVYRNAGGQMALARPLAYGQFLFTFLGWIVLTWGFIVHDFSIAYVAANSNSDLPLIYRITAVWGAHEGSFLLWMVMQS